MIEKQLKCAHVLRVESKYQLIPKVFIKNLTGSVKFP